MSNTIVPIKYSIYHLAHITRIRVVWSSFIRRAFHFHSLLILLLLIQKLQIVNWKTVLDKWQMRMLRKNYWSMWTFLKISTKRSRTMWRALAFFRSIDERNLTNSLSTRVQMIPYRIQMNSNAMDMCSPFSIYSKFHYFFWFAHIQMKKLMEIRFICK